MPDLPDARAMLILGAAARDAWESNPPDTGEWVRALDGCAELYGHAARHVEAGNFADAARCIGIAIEAGATVRADAILAYAMSGAAADDFMVKMREAFQTEATDGE